MCLDKEHTKDLILCVLYNQPGLEMHSVALYEEVNNICKQGILAVEDYIDSTKKKMILTQ